MKTLECVITLQGIRNLSIKNPFKKTIFNVGFVGRGEFKTKINGKRVYFYQVWYDMMKRCYTDKPNVLKYENVEVAEEWHNYQNFAKWCSENFKSFAEIEFELDKDLFQFESKHKIYSKDTCIFLPSHINVQIENVRYSDCGKFIITNVVRRNKSKKHPEIICRKYSIDSLTSITGKETCIGYFKDGEYSKCMEKVLEIKKENSLTTINFLRNLNVYTDSEIAKIKKSLDLSVSFYIELSKNPHMLFIQPLL